MRSLAIVSLLAVLTAVSCVPARMLDESKAKLKSCETELTALKRSTQESEAILAELKEQVANDSKTIAGLKRDTTIVGSSLRNMTSKYDKLNQLNEQLMDRLNKLLSGSEHDNAKLSGNLQMTTEQLLKKQDELKALETKLNQQKADLDRLNEELKKREARVNELESIIKQKEEASEALRKKMSEALVGFEGKGLSVTQRNGKVYVSLEESLLFESGKTSVQPKGVDALKNVAKVLEQNPDINIMVEGHTDDVPMKGAGEIKDNWDLSVMRATSVTKILLNNAKIEPRRIIAAGRAEYVPLDPGKNTTARKKNRRTEIILTPKLDELLKVLEAH